MLQKAITNFFISSRRMERDPAAFKRTGALKEDKDDGSAGNNGPRERREFIYGLFAYSHSY